MENRGSIILDCWPLVGKFGLTYSALVQYVYLGQADITYGIATHLVRDRYYHYMAEFDREALSSLEIAKDVMKRWAAGNTTENPDGDRTGSPQPLPFRAKVADIVNLLWESARGFAPTNVASRTSSTETADPTVNLRLFQSDSMPGSTRRSLTRHDQYLLSENPTQFRPLASVNPVSNGLTLDDWLERLINGGLPAAGHDQVRFMDNQTMQRESGPEMGFPHSIDRDGISVSTQQSQPQFRDIFEWQARQTEKATNRSIPDRLTGMGWANSDLGGLIF